MLIELQESLRASLRDGINLFLGAGFSLLANDRSGAPLLTGAGLKYKLIAQFGLGDVEALMLSQIATIIESTKKDEFYDFLRKHYTVGEFDERYKVLDRFNIKSIFTTNIDDLAFRIYENSVNHYLNDRNLRGATFHDRSAIDYVALHGSIAHEGEHLEFGTTDLAVSFSSDRDKWHYLTNQIQNWPTLFWGYGLEDAGILQALHPSTIQHRSHGLKWIVLYQPTEGAKAYFRALGFKLIESDTSEILDYLEGLPSSTTVVVPQKIRPTSELFPLESIPPVGSVPVRPMAEFYSGMAPVWHDIFSNGIHRTEHFYGIINSIQSGTHTMVIGLPACGKSTLLMQTAAAANFDGHKLVTDSLTTEKAKLLLNKLAKEPALIFIDNATSDVDALNILARVPTVLLVAFDRDYNFERALHLIDRRQYNVIPVTELSDLDAQAIYNKVPPAIRSPYFIRPSVEEGVAPSVFEFVNSNILGQTLAERFEQLLRSLQKTDPLLHDVLVMVCYVHSCGVPASYDTVSAFLRGDIDDYEEVSLYIERLGAIMSNYIGSLAEEDQDYYTPRSTVVTNAVLEYLHAGSLRKVIKRFFENVSPLRICRFDIFRKRAYDAGLMRRVFPDWTEGLNFYQSLYDRFESPYVLQQGAIYLSHMKRFREAFVMIDEALLLTNNRVWSIRNSHAIILFRANIGKGSEDETVFRTLKQSMNILAECYIKDRRKAYHALTFADQSIQFAELFPIDEAKQYLRTADRWLTDEQQRSPWNRDVKRLGPIVKRKLQSM